MFCVYFRRPGCRTWRVVRVDTHAGACAWCLEFDRNGYESYLLAPPSFLGAA